MNRGKTMRIYDIPGLVKTALPAAATPKKKPDSSAVEFGHAIQPYLKNVILHLHK